MPELDTFIIHVPCRLTAAYTGVYLVWYYKCAKFKCKKILLHNSKDLFQTKSLQRKLTENKDEPINQFYLIHFEGIGS